MSTYASTTAMGGRAAPFPAISLSFVSSLLTFWLPMLVIGAAMFGIQHSWHYASPAYLEMGSAVDLAAEVGGSSLLRELSFAAIGFMGVFLLCKRAEEPVALDKWLVGAIVGAGRVCFSECRLVGRIGAVSQAVGSAIGTDNRCDGGCQTLVAAAAVPVCAVVHNLRPVARFCRNATPGDVSAGRGLPLFRDAGPQRAGRQLCGAMPVGFGSVLPRAGFGAPTELRYLILFGIGFVFLLLTRSRTATAALAVALLVFFLAGASLRRKLLTFTALTMIAAVCGIFYLTRDPGPQGFGTEAIQMGREADAASAATLTGRVEIWHQVVNDISERPLLGYASAQHRPQLHQKYFGMIKGDADTTPAKKRIVFDDGKKLSGLSAPTSRVRNTTGRGA